MNKKTLIVITGPTASGKSALAVSLAKKLQTEIISADSRQIYKGIPVVTAVPTLEERENIPHHLMEILPLESYYSAALFRENSIEKLEGIFNNSDYAIVCGGSMLYIRTLIEGIDELPTVPDSIRTDLTEKWKENGDEWLLQKAISLDPEYCRSADLKNLKRIFHAVEISLTAGKPYSSLLSQNKVKASLPFDTFKFCMSGSRDLLFSRINYRVLEMMKNGLIDEAQSVFHLRHLNSLNTVGLKEMFAYFDGTFTKEEAVARIQKNTRVYAKKQLTWHKRDENIRYLDFSESIEKNTKKILSQIWTNSTLKIVT